MRKYTWMCTDTIAGTQRILVLFSYIKKLWPQFLCLSANSHKEIWGAYHKSAFYVELNDF